MDRARVSQPPDRRLMPQPPDCSKKTCIRTAQIRWTEQEFPNLQAAGSCRGRQTALKKTCIRTAQIRWTEQEFPNLQAAGSCRSRQTALKKPVSGRRRSVFPGVTLSDLINNCLQLFQSGCLLPDCGHAESHNFRGVLWLGDKSFFVFKIHKSVKKKAFF